MPPAARRGPENVQVQVAGSDPVALFQYVAWRRLLALTSSRTRVQPAGGVIVEVPRMVTAARSRSPATSEAGRARVSDVVIALFEPYAAERNVIPAGGVTSVTVQLNVSVASSGRPGVSRTVTLTAYGPGAALKAIVPLIRPLEVLIVRPGGRFVAPYTRVSPSGSVAAADRLITAPSASVRLGRSWLNVGGPLGGGSVTVQLNVSVASSGRPGVSRTVTLTAYGPGAAVEPIVPLIRPLEVLIVRPGGRFVAPYTRVSPSGSVAAADRLITAPSASVRLGRSWLNVGGPLGGGPPAAGRRAISWPMLRPASEAVATRVPVGPAAAWRASLPSMTVSRVGSVPICSPRSVMPGGGVIVAFVVMLKKATRRVLATVVVTPGAVRLVPDGLAWPPWMSIGVVAWTPL